MTDETTVVPTPAAPATAPAIPPAASRPGASRGRRVAGRAGQVVGILGIIASLALVVGVLVGRGWVAERVDGVAATLDAAVARALPLVDRAQATVGDIAVRVGETAAAAEVVAVDPAATPEALQRVLARLSALSQRYLDLRGTYAGVREEVVSALDRLTLLTRFVPGVSVPQGPVDALAALDERARTLDGGIMQVVEAGAAVNAVNQTAQAIADKARGVESSLAGVTEGLDQIEARLATLRAEIAGLASTITSVVTIVAVVLVLLLLYGAFLHWVLFRSSRGLARASAAG